MVSVWRKTSVLACITTTSTLLERADQLSARNGKLVKNKRIRLVTAEFGKFLVLILFMFVVYCIIQNVCDKQTGLYSCHIDIEYLLHNPKNRMYHKVFMWSFVVVSKMLRAILETRPSIRM